MNLTTMSINTNNLNKNEKKVIKYFFIISFFLAIIINKNYKSFSWAFMNTYLAVSLFFYALIKRSITFLIMVNCVISSMLLYYALKHLPNETFEVMEFKLVLSSFGFSFISCVIYWYYNFKKLNFKEVARLVLLSGSISYMFSMFVGFLSWAILIGGLGVH